MQVPSYAWRRHSRNAPVQTLQIDRLHGLHSTAHRQDVFVFNSYFLSSLIFGVVLQEDAAKAENALHEWVQKNSSDVWARRLFASRLVLFPVVAYRHFSCMALCEMPTLVTLLRDRDVTSNDPLPCLLSFDSLPYHEKYLAGFAKVCRKLVVLLWNKYGDGDRLRWRPELADADFPYYAVPTPQQPDSVSCGWCALRIMRLVMEAVVQRKLVLTRAVVSEPKQLAAKLKLFPAPDVFDVARGRRMLRLLWDRLSADPDLLRQFTVGDVSQDESSPEANQSVAQGYVQRVLQHWRAINDIIRLEGSPAANRHGVLGLAVCDVSEQLRSLYLPSELPNVFSKLVAVATAAGQETLGMLYGRSNVDGTLVVTHLVLPPQEGGANWCQPTGGSEIYEALARQGLQQLGWIHVGSPLPRPASDTAWPRSTDSLYNCRLTRGKSVACRWGTYIRIPECRS